MQKSYLGLRLDTLVTLSVGKGYPTAVNDTGADRSSVAKIGTLVLYQRPPIEKWCWSPLKIQTPELNKHRANNRPRTRSEQSNPMPSNRRKLMDRRIILAESLELLEISKKNGIEIHNLAQIRKDDMILSMFANCLPVTWDLCAMMYCTIV